MRAPCVCLSVRIPLCLNAALDCALPSSHPPSPQHQQTQTGSGPHTPPLAPNTNTNQQHKHQHRRPRIVHHHHHHDKRQQRQQQQQRPRRGALPGRLCAPPRPLCQVQRAGGACTVGCLVGVCIRGGGGVFTERAGGACVLGWLAGWCGGGFFPPPHTLFNGTRVSSPLPSFPPPPPTHTHIMHPHTGDRRGHVRAARPGHQPGARPGPRGAGRGDGGGEGGD